MFGSFYQTKFKNIPNNSLKFCCCCIHLLEELCPLIYRLQTGSILIWSWSQGSRWISMEFGSIEILSFSFINISKTHFLRIACFQWNNQPFMTYGKIPWTALTRDSSKLQVIHLGLMCLPECLNIHPSAFLYIFLDLLVIRMYKNGM